MSFLGQTGIPTSIFLADPGCASSLCWWIVVAIIAVAKCCLAFVFSAECWDTCHYNADVCLQSGEKMGSRIVAYVSKLHSVEDVTVA